MMDPVFVEEIFAELLLPGKQSELLPRRKGERGAQPFAARTIADNSVIEIGIDLEAHAAALAASMIMRRRHFITSP
jgi:hypothetical protein